MLFCCGHYVIGLLSCCHRLLTLPSLSPPSVSLPCPFFPSQMIAINRGLLHLDLTNTRMGADAALMIAEGLISNTVLEVCVGGGSMQIRERKGGLKEGAEGRRCRGPCEREQTGTCKVQRLQGRGPKGCARLLQQLPLEQLVAVQPVGRGDGP